MFVTVLTETRIDRKRVYLGLLALPRRIVSECLRSVTGSECPARPSTASDDKTGTSQRYDSRL
jgi:hypothetical protein